MSFNPAIGQYGKKTRFRVTAQVEAIPTQQRINRDGGKAQSYHEARHLREILSDCVPSR